MARPHGSAPRGLDLAPKSSLFEGRFGRIFRALPPAEFGATEKENIDNLAALAAEIVSQPDPVKDGADGEESGIPALYTYFGQFIDHDLTFDPVSSLQKQNDPDALVDFRTPAFDLDCIYGRGPDDQPYLYELDGMNFVLGKEMTGTALTIPINGAHDLPRANDAKSRTRPDSTVDERKRALIGDPRNDENVIVSQLQGIFHRFHNRVVKEHPALSFTDVQRVVRFHYQWVIVHDFLRKIIAKRVITKVLPHLTATTYNVATHPPVLKYFHAKNNAFMPLEFAAAAYRMGHSMVRPGYRLNDADLTLQPIFPFEKSGGVDDQGNQKPQIVPGLTGFGQFPPGWAIDWARFIDLEPRPEGPDTEPSKKNRMQLAYRIDASLVDPLGSLPFPITEDAKPLNSLAARNLVRGWRMRLPSGQAIARAMGVTPLEKELLLGKEEEGADPNRTNTVTSVNPVFQDNCPLWVYVLAEAAHELRVSGHTLPVQVSEGKKSKTIHIKTAQLGDVGGTIVAETFAGILLEDSNSYWNLDPNFKPFLKVSNGEFALRDFVAYALGK